MGRPARILLLALGLLAFLAVSLALARTLSANSAERTAILELLEAQARGDAAAMVARIDGCARRPACVEQARENATRLRSRGRVEIVRLDASTSFAPAGGDGVARVVWRTPARTTVVQCVDVHRGGDALAGLTIALRGLSRPIDREGSCPGKAAPATRAAAPSPS